MSIEKATAAADRETVSIGNYLTHLDETKRGLAKLLARENITVRHETTPTAMFDVVDRVLVLPKFDSVSVDQYDLLIGHEVGHAKYSSGPTSIAILQECRNFDGLHTYLNVIEDTRIERLMKEEYPGLRASFRRGYADFATHGPLFQEVAGEDISSYSFIDRINMQYKIGAHRDVPFTDAERAYFPRIDTLDSMTEAFELAKELYDADVEAQKNAPKQPGQEPESESEQSSDQNGDGDNQNGDSQDGDNQNADSQDGDNQNGDQNGDNQNGDSQDGDNQNGDSQDDTGKSTKSQGTDGQSQDADGADSNDDKQDASPQSAGANTAKGPAGPHAKTDVANAEALEGIASQKEEHESAPIVVDLRPLTPRDMERFTTTFFDDVQEFFGVYPTLHAAARRYLDKFNQKHGATVKFMAREFELKKTAKLAERARTSRTGRLDVSKLYAYKFREDLFQSVTVLPNGKSHGVVVVIDGSGSMQNVMSDTLDQALLFGSFAKAVGIPFKAVVFRTDRYQGGVSDEEFFTSPKDGSKTLLPSGVTLATILDTTAPKWKEQLVQTAAFAMKFEQGYNGSMHDVDANGTPLVSSAERYSISHLPHCDLGSTPLYGGLLIAERLVETMKSTHRLDKMTMLIVTDGSDSEGLYLSGDDKRARVGGYYDQPMAIRDTVTRRVYADYASGTAYTGYRDGSDRHETVFHAGRNALLKALVGSIQERHDCRVVTIKVLPPRSRYTRSRGNADLLSAAAQFARTPARACGTVPSEWSITNEDALKSMKEDGQVVFHAKDIVGDAAILVSASRLHLDIKDEKDADTPLTPRQIKSAFVKRAVAGSRNRVFVQTVIPFLA